MVSCYSELAQCGDYHPGMEVTIDVNKKGKFSVSYYKGDQYLIHRFDNFGELELYALENFIESARYKVLFRAYKEDSMTRDAQIIVDKLDGVFSKVNAEQIPMSRILSHLSRR